MKESIEKYIEYLKNVIIEKRHDGAICSKLGYTLQAKSIADEISIYKEIKDNMQNILNSQKK